MSSNSTQGGETGSTSSGTKIGNAEPSSPVIFTNDPDPYGSSEGGAIYASGDDTVLINQSQITSNIAVGRSGLNSFFQQNGEDAGNAQGGTIYINMTGGTFTINNNSTLDQNSAEGQAGGNYYNRQNDSDYNLAGKGGDAEGGAISLNQGSLTISGSELGSNAATAGMNGLSEYGVVAAEAPVYNGPTPTPSRDQTRTGLAEGGAIFVKTGTLNFTDDTLDNNSATAQPGQPHQGGVVGAIGGNASGGAIYLANTTGTGTLTSTVFTGNAVNASNGAIGWVSLVRGERRRGRL